MPGRVRPYGARGRRHGPRAAGSPSRPRSRRGRARRSRSSAPTARARRTLVEALAGLRAVTAGSIELDGASRSTRLPARGAPVGIASRTRCCSHTFSVLENVAFPLRARGTPGPTRASRAREILARCWRPGSARTRDPSDLSGGERSASRWRVRSSTEPPAAAARRAARGASTCRRAPELRDAPARRRLGAFEGACVLVTHDPVEAMTLADRVVVLEDGRRDADRHARARSGARRAPATRPTWWA